MILVLGGTGTVGSHLVRALARHRVDVEVVSTSGARAELPPNVRAVQGDVRDLDLMRGLLARTRTLFVLNPVVADEMTRALVTLSLAVDAGIQRVVYFSMLGSDTWTDVPHAAAKFAAERMIADREIPTSILRPCYFFQNDAWLRDSLLQRGVYPGAIGKIGIEMVDARDAAEVAAHELLRRERADGPLPTETIEIVGPEALTGEAVAQIWSDVLQLPVRYGGDVATVEQAERAHLSPEMARDLALMYRRFNEGGYHGTFGAAVRLSSRLGRRLRTYREFAEEQRDEWLATRPETPAPRSAASEPATREGGHQL
jgi:uncharacterized protein YbjT (DUF2867 family)